MSDFFKDLAENRKKLWIFIPLLLLYAISYFHRTGIPGTVFSQLLQEGFTAEAIGAIASAFIMVYSVSQVISGMLADKYSGVRVVTIGGLLFIIGTNMLPFCHSLLMINVSRIIAGFGASTMYLSLVREADRLFGRKNFSIFLGIIYFVGYIGGMCGAYPFERLCAYFDWRNVLICLGAVTIILYIVFLFGKRVEKLPSPSALPISFFPLLSIMKNPYAWLVLYCSSVNFGTFSIMQMVFGKKFLEDCGNFSSATASIVISCLTIVCMTLLLLNGIFIRMVGNRRKPFMIGASSLNFLTTVMMIMVLYFDLPKYFLIIGFICYAVSSAGTLAYTLTAQEINSKDIMTLATGFNNMGCYFFVAAGALLLGKVLDLFLPADFAGGDFTYPIQGYIAVLGIILVFSFIGIILMFFAPETKGHYFNLRLKLKPQTKKIK
ncbi:MAG: MFS transporter [Lentisphaeria bacterium]|nr:MFS transporter [Lentisphaeria bacterium]